MSSQSKCRSPHLHGVARGVALLEHAGFDLVAVEQLAHDVAVGGLHEVLVVAQHQLHLAVLVRLLVDPLFEPVACRR